jgi:hypothetical protein
MQSVDLRHDESLTRHEPKPQDDGLTDNAEIASITQDEEVIQTGHQIDLPAQHVNETVQSDLAEDSFSVPAESETAAATTHSEHNEMMESLHQEQLVSKDANTSAETTAVDTEQPSKNSTGDANVSVLNFDEVGETVPLLSAAKDHQATLDLDFEATEAASVEEPAISTVQPADDECGLENTPEGISEEEQVTVDAPKILEHLSLDDSASFEESPTQAVEDMTETLEMNDDDSDFASDDDLDQPDDTINYADLVCLEEPTIHQSLLRDAHPPSTPPGQLVRIDNDNSPVPQPVSPLIKTPQLDPPSPTFEDATATMTFVALNQLEDDKAILQSFLDRAAARKSDKQGVTCAKQEKLESRRDSDAVRHALASPRMPLEAKDSNLFSPRKTTEETENPALSDVKNQNEVASLIIPPLEELVPTKPTKKGSPRRSGRARKTSNQSQGTASKKGTATVKSSEEALAALQTRQNTRKNKGTALTVIDRLVKLRAEFTVFGVLKDGGEMSDSGGDGSKTAQKTKKKAVKWREHLWMLDQNTGQTEIAPLLDNAPAPKAAAGTSVAGQPAPPMKSGKVSTRGQTARLRKLGAMNGTPAKEILGSTVLPEELIEQQEASAASISTGSPKKVAAGSVVSIPTGAKVTKSRLPAPKKLNLNPSVASVAPALQSVPTQSEKLGTDPASASNARSGLKKKLAIPKTASLLPGSAVPRRAVRTKT